MPGNLSPDQACEITLAGCFYEKVCLVPYPIQKKDAGWTAGLSLCVNIAQIDIVKSVLFMKHQVPGFLCLLRLQSHGQAADRFFCIGGCGSGRVSIGILQNNKIQECFAYTKESKCFLFF